MSRVDYRNYENGGIVCNYRILKDQFREGSACELNSYFEQLCCVLHHMIASCCVTGKPVFFSIHLMELMEGNTDLTCI